MLHQFSLYTLQDGYRCWERAFVHFFADFVLAFPSAWSALILAEAKVSAGVRDGALALLASILKDFFGGSNQVEILWSIGLTAFLKAASSAQLVSF